MQPTTGETFTKKQIKVMRRRAVQHELDLYAAISGKTPGILPRRKANGRAKKVRFGSSAKPWSATVLAAHLQNLAMPRLAIFLKRLAMADWLRRLSVQALDRLLEAQARIASPRQSSRARSCRDDPRLN